MNEVPDSRVVKTTASQGHEMYCSRSGAHEFEPSWVKLWVHSINVKVVLQLEISI